MTAYLIVLVASFGTSAITLYSGFGLGTLLLPVYSLFFSIEVAITATAIVHAANNAFKIAVVGRHADRSLVLRFGLPAIIAAFFGASALGLLSGFEPIARYAIGTHEAVVTPIKLSIGLLMLVFALVELLPYFRRLEFGREYLVVGGLLSGFFGGLSGHQGALRSAFLAKTNVSPETFVATNAVVGFLVDIARIATYAVAFVAAGTNGAFGSSQYPLIATGILAAFAGVMVARRFLRKMTMETVQTITGAMLIGIAIGLASGVI